MKLIKRTYLHTFIWLLPVIIIGSVYCFYMIRFIIYEETDEYLTYEMERLVDYYNQNKNLPEFHKVADIIEGVKYETPVFKDTHILEPGDNELVPHRELYFSIVHKEKYFTIVLRHLLPGNDDILEGTLIIIVGLLLLITAILFFMLNHISGKIWAPFYKTLQRLKKYRINENPPTFPASGIDEFNTLNDTVNSLLSKISHDYARTKEFNENASHELQTHLAIIRANAGKLLNEPGSGPNNIKTAQEIQNAAIKLSRSQKSLLLLSKIGNLEFNKSEEVNLKALLQQVLLLFDEAVGIRGINVSVIAEECTREMDPGLADIFLTNLIKNAVKHNVQNGFISISLTPSCLVIENSGLPFIGNPDIMLERFVVGVQGNSGIGLSIVKQICNLYQYSISYQVVNQSTHRITIHL
ncbi:MAG: HAMP domain-containing histidine kinase [Bacteroidales bacterium]|nr:HAMP domain-containing histidine kinase [Bacteroidales bacterium]